MKVVITGYGRMGKMVEEHLNRRGHSVLQRVDSAGSGDVERLTSSVLEGADGVIEFALAGGMADRLEVYAASGLPVVIGTTGWDSLADRARSLYENNSGALLQGSNFSIGAHIFFHLTAAAARLINRLEEYDVSLTEYHHRGKADYPSGTAITAAQGVLTELDRKNRIMKDLPDGPIPGDAIQVAAVRVGSVPGIHEMRMDSSSDFLTIEHQARQRGGFASGAVLGLEWLRNKTGWHGADEFFKDFLKGPPL